MQGQIVEDKVITHRKLTSKGLSHLCEMFSKHHQHSIVLKDIEF